MPALPVHPLYDGAIKKLKFYLRDMGNDLRLRAAASISQVYRRQTRMPDNVNRFLGDTPGRTLVKLIVVCLLVGFVLAFFGFTPDNIIGAIRYHVLDIWYNGFVALGRVGSYLALGAIVVIPVFLILRLLSFRR